MTTKTAREMFAKLKRLESEIRKKNRELNNLQVRHRVAGTGSRNVIPYYNRIVMANKNTYTNANYKKNFANALRIVYNERKPLMNKYNKTASKYRALVGLPRTGRKSEPWPKIVHFGRYQKRNVPLPNLNMRNIYINHRAKGVQMTSGGGGGFHHASLGVTLYKFHPNKELLNALLTKQTIQKWRGWATERALRPPRTNNNNNKGGSAYSIAAKRWT